MYVMMTDVKHCHTINIKRILKYEINKVMALTK